MKWFSRRRRLPHLGPYPMEQVARVDRPTTRIDDAAVPRVPFRANFFSRAAHGDLGDRVAEEIKRFNTKTPLSLVLRNFAAMHPPFQDGETAGTTAPLTDDPKKNAEHIKALLYFLGADIVGICEAPAYAWYSHDADGAPVEPRHRYAIVIAIDQGFDTMDAANGNDWVSSGQSQRAYLMGSTFTIVAADYIRQLGFGARAHTNADSEVLHLPLALLAGIGELSRIGEVIINPFLGPRFKTAVITTDLALAVDKPIDFGLQDFCEKCRKCARECPCAAISYGDKIMFNGYEMWKPDAETCVKYRISNPGGTSCGRCMKVCPFNKEGLVQHRIGLWAAIHLPWTRRLLIWLDDALGYGQRNDLKKWWRDLELVNGVLQIARKVNRRGLKKNKADREKHKIAIYPAEVNPPADASGAVPVDRIKALEDGLNAEPPQH